MVDLETTLLDIYFPFEAASNYFTIVISGDTNTVRI